jgi:hypothetical protein
MRIRHLLSLATTLIATAASITSTLTAAAPTPAPSAATAAAAASSSVTAVAVGGSALAAPAPAPAAPASAAPIHAATPAHPFPLPRATRIPDTLYLVSHAGLNTPEMTTLATLQGQLARLGDDEGIYIINPKEKSAYATWLELLQIQNPAARCVSAPAFPALLKHFSKKIPHYITYDKTAPETLHVATTLAVGKPAIVIDLALEHVAKTAGLTPIADASTRTLLSLTDGELAPINKNLVMEIPLKTPAELRDYIILAQSLSFPANNDTLAQTIMSRHAPGARALGWGDGARGENVFITRNSRLGIATLPADHIRNLSLLTALDAKSPLKQKPTAAEIPSGGATPHKPGHIVTIAVSDGDNPCAMLESFGVGTRWFAAPARGAIPVGWGFPPALAELAPGIVEYFYQHAAPNPKNPKLTNDHYLAGPSGNGYFYPGRMPRPALAQHCASLNQVMAAAGLRIVQVIDFDTLDDTALWSLYTAQPSIDAILYCDFVPYDKGKGRVIWSNNKPVISARHMLWRGLKGADAGAIARSINSASTDTTSTDAYSYIIVHMWSHTYDDIVALVQKFAPHVRVVPPDEFIRLIQRTAPKQTAPNQTRTP